LPELLPEHVSEGSGDCRVAGNSPTATPWPASEKYVMWRTSPAQSQGAIRARLPLVE
jgi:hypothetical protein